MDRLNLWYHDQRIGHLERDGSGLWRFLPDPDWQSFMLSPHLPLGATVVDSENRRTVEWFFENLLPEGNLREFLARKMGVRTEDTWALIRQYGKDVAGALSILPDGEAPDDEKPALTPISTEKLASMIREAQATGVPVMAQGTAPHISLAGAQEKFALHRDASGAWWQPQGTTPSTWILKPENSSPRYPFCPANEWSSLPCNGSSSTI